MEIGSSLSDSQEPATGPYPEPDASNPLLPAQVKSSHIITKFPSDPLLYWESG
jgi:hypothetical protein